MEKKEFIAVLEHTLLCADLDVTELFLIDDNTVQITFKGGGKLPIGEDNCLTADRNGVFFIRCCEIFVCCA